MNIVENKNNTSESIFVMHARNNMNDIRIYNNVHCQVLYNIWSNVMYNLCVQIGLCIIIYIYIL